jgi:chromosome segregation ATPase
MGCARTYWRLRDLEKAFLTFVRELDLSVLSDDGSNERDQLARSIQADEGRLEDLRNQRAKCIDAILVVPESRALLDRLKQLEAEIVSTERQLSTKTERIRTIVYETEAKSRSREQVRSLVEELQKGGDEVLAVRSTLRAHLRDIIDRIELHMGDPAPVGRRWSAESRAGRAFAVHFRDGTYRVVYPQGQDPTKFEMIWHTPRTSSSGP